MQTVLIIDDEPLVRETVSRMVAGEGRRVLQAAGGFEGIKIVDAEHVDVVLCDFHMPEISGPETVIALRRKSPGLKIIAMSGSIEEETLELAKQCGADATLLKPFRRAQVIALLSKLAPAG